MFQSQNEYFTELLNNPKREKPVVEYLPAGIGEILVGQRAKIFTYGHPAAYLDDAPWVNTSAVVSYDEATGDLETRNTLYVLKKKVDKQ